MLVLSGPFELAAVAMFKARSEALVNRLETPLDESWEQYRRKEKNMVHMGGCQNYGVPFWVLSMTRH